MEKKIPGRDPVVGFSHKNGGGPYPTDQEKELGTLQSQKGSEEMDLKEKETESIYR